MSNLNPLTLLICLVFVSLGVFGFFNGKTPSDQMMFAGVIAFFGGGLAIELANLMPSATPFDVSPQTFIIRTSYLRVIVLGLGCLGFVIVGAVMMFLGMQGNSVWLMALGGAGFVFGGGFLWFVIRRLFAAGTEYIVDADGIESRIGIRWRLAWSDIQAIGVGGVSNNYYIVLETFESVPDPKGFFTKLNRTFGMPPYTIGSATNGVNMHALANRLYDMLQQGQELEQDQ